MARLPHSRQARRPPASSAPSGSRRTIPQSWPTRPLQAFCGNEATTTEIESGICLYGEPDRLGSIFIPKLWRGFFAFSASAAAICDAKQCWHHKDLPCHSSPARSQTDLESAGAFMSGGSRYRFDEFAGRTDEDG